MLINENTSIATLLRANPAALDIIVRLAPGFSKLKNPLVRKLMAGRTNIAMAAEIGRVEKDVFFEKLEVLGFKRLKSDTFHEAESAFASKEIFPFNTTQMDILDVRPILQEGTDPLKIILQKLDGLTEGISLQIVNTFIPYPLIKVMEKKGYKAYIQEEDYETIRCTFYSDGTEYKRIIFGQETPPDTTDFEEQLEKYKDNILQINVREMEMPLPMTTIIETLQNLPSNIVLHVLHKRYPAFLIPEIQSMGYSFSIKQISEVETELLFYKNNANQDLI